MVLTQTFLKYYVLNYIMKLVLTQTFLKYYALNYIIFFLFVITIIICDTELELIQFYDSFSFISGFLALDNCYSQKNRWWGRPILTDLLVFMNRLLEWLLEWLLELSDYWRQPTSAHIIWTRTQTGTLRIKKKSR